MEKEDWIEKAKCKGMDTSIFFPSSKEPDLHQKIKKVKLICYSCPVKKECLTHAIVEEESFGIWGGITERKISRLRNEIGSKDKKFVKAYLEVRKPSVWS